MDDRLAGMLVAIRCNKRKRRTQSQGNLLLGVLHLYYLLVNIPYSDASLFPSVISKLLDIILGH